MAPHPVDQAAHAAQAASNQAQSSASRFFKWVEDNSKLVLAVTAGTAVVAGAGVYYYSGKNKVEPPRRPDADQKSEKSADGTSSSAAAAGEAASSKSSKKKKKSGNKGAGKDGSDSSADPLADPNGPLLEEASEKDLFALPVEQISKLPQERREPLAQALKTAGNKAYQARKFDEAIKLYTKAIAAQPLAVFFSNRAACYSNIGQYRKVIEDCDSALELDPRYSKALNRRANAAKQLGSGLDPEQSSPEFEVKTNYLYRALLDFTAVTLLSEFRDQAAGKELESVIQELATLRTKETLRTREVKLPSPVFLAAFFDTFRKRPFPELPEGATQGDQTLRMAYEALDARNYPHAFSLVNEAIDQDLSSDYFKALAFNLQGSFWFVVGRPAQSLECFNKAVELAPEHGQSWIKRASALLESGDSQGAFASLDKAEQIDPQDPDVAYQRGQIRYLMGDLDAALKDYEKSIALDGTRIYAYIQRAVALYKLEKLDAAHSEFQSMIRKFEGSEGSAEAHNFYGEVLLDTGRYEDAVKHFDIAIEIESQKTGFRSPVPAINKGLLLFQWKEDLGAAERLIREAVKMDEDHDVAVASLAQFSQLQGNIDEALKWFRKSASIARTEGELQNAILSELAALAQQSFITNFDANTATLQALAARHHFSQAQAQAYQS